jgi:hypothetical protein
MPKCTLSPRPSTTAQPFRGLASRGGNSASLEGSPPRPLEAQANSASPKTPLAEPSAGPRRGGKLCLARDHPRQTVAAAQLPDGTGRIYSPTTPRHGRESDGVKWRQPASATTPHSGRDRRPVRLFRPLCRYSRRGEGLRRPVWPSLTPPRHCTAYPLYFPPLQDPRRAWATTLGRGMALDWGKTNVCSTLDVLPHPTQGTAHSAAIATPSTGATGHGGALGTVGGFARMTTTPDAILHSIRRQERPTVLPRIGGRRDDPVDILHV